MSKYKDGIKLAKDRVSARTVDENGFMHVAGCNISKAVVNPYLGSEIPDWETLGLDPKKVYYIFRPPEELEKAASTFNKVPLLDTHVAVSAFDLEKPEVKKHIVGSTGGNAQFKAPYLVNDLVIWTAGSIEGVLTREQAELSCAYRYDILMESGEYEGTKYDGRMSNIRANHVAIVDEGRAGPDVMVRDSKEDLVKAQKKTRLLESLKGLGKDSVAEKGKPCETAEAAAKLAAEFAELHTTKRTVQAAAHLYRAAEKLHRDGGFTKQAEYHNRQATKLEAKLKALSSPHGAQDQKKLVEVATTASQPLANAKDSADVGKKEYIPKGESMKPFTLTTDENPTGINQYSGAAGKAHEKTAMATSAGKSASKATAKTDRHDEYSTHMEAAKSHSDAMKAHQSAGKAQRVAASKAPDKDTANRHHNLAANHEAEAENHKDSASQHRMLGRMLL